jgi:hypothetical protein
MNETHSSIRFADVESEARLLACCIIDGGEEVIAKCLRASLDEAAFFDPTHKMIFRAVASLHEEGSDVCTKAVTTRLEERNELSAIGGAHILAQIAASMPSIAPYAALLREVRMNAEKRRVTESANATLVEVESFNGCAEEFDDYLDALPKKFERSNRSVGSIIPELAPRRAGFGRVIPKQEPTFHLAKIPIFTRGNIGMITALQKVGKSTALGGMLGAVMGGEHCSGDTLHFAANNDAGQALIHFDTEQSPEDHERLFATALGRAGLSTPPAWLHSYGVKGLGVVELNRALYRLLKDASKAHGGIHSVILDGVADFVSDPNKPDECNPLVTKLETIATGFNCSVIAVLHLNPSPKGQPSKSRGHLGSQLERKCETDLRLAKDGDEVTTLYTACARHKPISEKDGPRFKWSTADGMHVSLELTKGGVRDSIAVKAARDLADDVFCERSSMTYTDLISAIRTTRKCSERTADRKFNEMRDAQIIARFPPNLWAKAA